MSFLAPFYLLAGLAIALPIAFHLIRRSPQGRRIFSSVMFLTPAPPRTTKRSHIEDWLLLLLRGAAIGLLALAFARPFLRSQQILPEAVAPGQKRLVLLDISASMRQPECWKQAQAHLNAILNQLQPADDFSLLAFDSTIHDVLTFEQWRDLPADIQTATVKEQIRSLAPGWKPTEAGRALITAMDRIHESDPSGQLKSILLISDMQSGAGWNELNHFPWPEDVTLQLLPVVSPVTTNASLQALQTDRPDPKQLRVRISNAAHSQGHEFQIQVHGPSVVEKINQPESSVSVTVPPGESQIVSLPLAQPGQATVQAQVGGDDIHFDNQLFAIPQLQMERRVAFLGSSHSPETPHDLHYFLPALFAETPGRRVDVVTWDQTDAPAMPASQTFHWLIIGDTPTPAQQNWIRHWVEQGGQALFIARTPEQAASLYSLLNVPLAMVTEVHPENEVMLSQLDFSHPALRPFDDPRYSDFTKLRFRKYRSYAIDSLPQAHVLAKFDDGGLALAEIPLGQGRITLLTSGWNRDDSDLAVSSKFVPLINGLLEQAVPQLPASRQMTVGQSLLLSELEFTGETLAVQIGDRIQTVPRTSRWEFEQPGFYRFAAQPDLLSGPAARVIAVNLPPAESKTDPWGAQQIAALGIPLASHRPAQAGMVPVPPEQRRQLLNRELESRQQGWRWLVMFALGCLFAESALAARKRLPPSVQTTAG